MRAFLASSIGVACTAALALPLSLHSAPDRAVRADSAGGTQSLPLLPLGADGPGGGGAALGGAVLGGAERASGATQGVAPRKVRPFSLVGVVWDDPAARLRGQVQVRTREAATGAWSPWRDLEALDEADAPDPDSPESRGGRLRGGTTPLWVGDSDGVQTRVSPRDDSGLLSGRPASLPSGLRLELVDPGHEPGSDLAGEEDAPTGGAATRPPSARPSGDDPATEIPAERDPSAEIPAERDPGTRDPGTPDPGTRDPSEGPSGQDPSSQDPSQAPSAELPPEAPQPDPEDPSAPPEPEPSGLSPEPPTPPSLELPEEPPDTNAGAGHPYTAPRPRIVTRAGWGADEKLRESGHLYTKTVKVAFVHHSVTGNAYTCSQAPSVMRAIYRYHVQSMGWRDFGYNFAVDKCGNIYEGRSGGVTKAVQGAHTLGFNKNSMGIAVLGTYSSKKPSSKAVKAVAKLTAWKLGLFGRNPGGTTHLTSAGGNKYKKGTKAKLRVISGHRDGYNTECPGGALYRKLGTVRDMAARLQGR
ncbi:N-acetylmuramoyl-L-alanine amidase [Streptomyces cuspidosporus]|uniref:Peptidoglycan recognition protein family domain-containing protein n=1 Tax=Streptomyces cuspidosporus TaxID=66882 RepID=A0ABN3H4C0_9ACTN